MNDFTKKELELIMDAMHYWVIQIENPPPEETDLLDKIHSMIENYGCEHEWINNTYCEKCNKSCECH
jgi:hypothetical protein